MRHVAFVAQQNEPLGVRVADGRAEGIFTSFEGLAGGRGDVVRSDVVLPETRVHEVSGTPGFARVIAAKDSVEMRRMETGAGIHGVHGERPGIGGKQLMVLGDGAIGPLIGFAGFGVESFAHSRLPALAAIARTVEPAFENAILLLAANGAIEYDDAALPIRAAGKALKFVPRQSLGFLDPGAADVVGTPNAFSGGGEHRLISLRALSLPSP